MDSHEIPLAAIEKLQDLLPVGLGFLRTLQLRNGGGARTQDLPYRHTGNAPHPSNLSFPHSLLV